MAKKWRRQRAGYHAGLVSGLLVVAFLYLPENERLHAPGPMNTGHENLKCAYCHRSAAGSLRQQLQAKARHVLGLRDHGAVLGLRPVGNEACLSCHERPEDSHPVFRFLEPKYTEAREKIRPHLCTSCHLEHTGRRATVAMTFCRHCHEDLKLRKDPVSISHEQQVKKERWDLCLRCHDYHGNHRMKVEKKILFSHDKTEIGRYLAGGTESPYSRHKRYKARKKPPDEGA